MATVIGIFEDQFVNNELLTVVKPGTQSRRFTHIYDTIEVCYEAWKKNKCAHYSISHKNLTPFLKLQKCLIVKLFISIKGLENDMPQL